MSFFLTLIRQHTPSYQDLLDDESTLFALFLLTPNTQPKTINDWRFALYGLGHDNRPTLIESTLQDFASFLSGLATQNPIFLPETSLPDYSTIIQVNYVATNFSKIFFYTNSVNPLPVMEGADESYHISDFGALPQTITVSDSVSASPSGLTCLYGCPYKPKSSADSSSHNQNKHKKSRDKIVNAIASGSTCSLCPSLCQVTFLGFRHFSRHMLLWHRDSNYKDFIDHIK